MGGFYTWRSGKIWKKFPPTQLLIFPMRLKSHVCFSENNICLEFEWKSGKSVPSNFHKSVLTSNITMVTFFLGGLGKYSLGETKLLVNVRESILVSVDDSGWLKEHCWERLPHYFCLKRCVNMGLSERERNICLFFMQSTERQGDVR